MSQNVADQALRVYLVAQRTSVVVEAEPVAVEVVAVERLFIDDHRHHDLDLARDHQESTLATINGVLACREYSVSLDETGTGAASAWGVY